MIKGKLENWNDGIMKKWQVQSIIPYFHHFNKNTFPIKITVEPIKLYNDNK